MKKLLCCIFCTLLIFLCACSENNNANLIKNADFEKETGKGVSSWQLDGYYPTDSDCGVVYDESRDSNVLKIVSSGNNDVRFLQNVKLQKNSYYCFSAYVKTENVSGTDGSGANLSVLKSYNALSEFQTGSEDWHRVRLYLSTGNKSETVSLCLRLGFYSMDARGTALFDDISLKKVEKSAINSTEFIQPISDDAALAVTGSTKTENQIKLSALLRGMLYGILLFAFYSILKKTDMSKKVFFLLLAISLLVRLIASVMYKGFSVDINCFSSWGSLVASQGITKFYSATSFCDYPPLYMLVCGALSLVADLFRISLSRGVGLLILKLPAIICDVLCALMLYKICKNFVCDKKAKMLAVLYAFNPVAILNCAVWGQVDSILLFLMLVAFDLMFNDQFGKAVLVFFVGLLTKPQAILFGPIMIIGAVNEFYTIFKEKNSAKKRLINGFGALGICVASFVLISLLLKNGQDFDWLYKKYVSTFASYNYATLNSFGFMGLIGGQWQNADGESLFGISYNLLGTLLCLAVGGITVWGYLSAFKKRTLAIYPLCALLLSGIITFAPRTHERYIFPVIAFLLISAAIFNDKKLTLCAIGYSFINFVNTAIVLYLYEDMQRYLDKADGLFIGFSFLSVALFVLTAIFILKNLLDKNMPKKEDENRLSAPVSEKSKSAKKQKSKPMFAGRGDKPVKITLKDVTVCLIITAVYACVALTNLGDKVAPQTYWQTEAKSVYTILDFGKSQTFDSILYSPESSSGSFKLAASEDGLAFDEFAYINLPGTNVNCWSNAFESSVTARYIKVTATSGLSLNEMAFFADGEAIVPEKITNEGCPVDAYQGENLFDAQASVNNRAESVPIPVTSWDDGGTIDIKLFENKEISNVLVYSTYAESGAIVGFMAYNEDFCYVSPAGDNSWTSGSFLDTKKIFTSEISVYGTDAIHASEIILLDENGEIIPIKEISSESSLGANAFDEQDSYKYVIEAKKTFGDSRSWSVSALGDYVIADFGTETPVKYCSYYTSVCEGSFDVYFSVDGNTWVSKGTPSVQPGMLYYWHGLPNDKGQYENLTARYVAIVGKTADLRLLEMGFYSDETSSSIIPIENVTSFSGSKEHSADMLFDEQSLVCREATYKNSMYFDEIYHARTAFEGLNNMPIYEWTHPPLGKDIISWSVALLGMTPFAWRLPGTIFGILMIPAIFFLGLFLFRKRSWASLGAILLALDGMHYVQTRIATVDSFPVLFIICMFMFMFRYISYNFFETDLKKTFVPLGLCGISFGLGAASKWIGLYAGAGLAVVFFAFLFARFREYLAAKRALAEPDCSDREYCTMVADTFVQKALKTLGFCVIFFIIIPAIIYCLSYYPYFSVKGETRSWIDIILQNQKSMYSYHSKLEATHPFQSDWYSWPVIYRPIWFYSGSFAPEGKLETISCFGNPAVWYASLVCTLSGIFMLIYRFIVRPQIVDKPAAGIFGALDSGEEAINDKSARDIRILSFLFIAFACNYLPWVGISRCIFIYHFFATVPFFMLFTVYILRDIARSNKKTALIMTIVLVFVSLILFIMFNPIWTGYAVSKEYVKTFLAWFPSWVFGC